MYYRKPMARSMRVLCSTAVACVLVGTAATTATADESDEVPAAAAPFQEQLDDSCGEPDQHIVIPDGQEAVGTLPSCDLPRITLEHNDVSVVLPEPGEGVSIEALTVDGSEHSLAVFVDQDGDVRVSDAESASADAGDSTTTASGAAGSTGGSDCTDRYYTTLGGSWNVHPWVYYINSATYPHSNTPTSFVTSVRNAADTWGRQTNNCGQSRLVSNGPLLGYSTGGSGDYRGNTSRVANITDGNSCGGSDGYSVISGGALPAGVLASNCRWYGQSGTGYIASDIKLNGWLYKFVTGTGCVGTTHYDMQTIMTHEFGHFVGLGHVAGHVAVMKPSFGTCEYLRTLQRSDLTGYFALY